jgi:flagellar basal-body rod protein FlgC
MIQGTSPATVTDIALSGLRAQSTRMRLISNNIANAQTTRTPDGGPYLRQDVELSTTERDGQEGVTVGRVFLDETTPLNIVQDPGHPDADANGFVTYPNVQVPQEMMQMITASRAYQANLAVLKRNSELSSASLELLR